MSEDKILNVEKNLSNMILNIEKNLIFKIKQTNNKEHHDNCDCLGELIDNNNPRQSPIDIYPSEFEIFSKDLLKFDVNKIIKTKKTITSSGNNFHFITQDEVITTFNNRHFKLLQYHFHNPSEHSYNGKRKNMEVHLVHQSLDKKNLFVMGFFINKGEKGPFDEALSLENDNPFLTLTKDDLKDFTLYNGSLTTTPFSSIVTWIMFKKELTTKINTDKIWADKGLGPARDIQTDNSPLQYSISN